MSSYEMAALADVHHCASELHESDGRPHVGHELVNPSKCVPAWDWEIHQGREVLDQQFDEILERLPVGVVAVMQE